MKKAPISRQSSPKKQTYEQWLISMWKKWSPRMHLTIHDVRLEISTEYYMACQCRYPYLDPIIYWSEKSKKDWKEDKILHEKRVVHEFCHLITDPLYSKAVARHVSEDEIKDERERLTDYIQRLLIP